MSVTVTGEPLVVLDYAADAEDDDGFVAYIQLVGSGREVGDRKRATFRRAGDYYDNTTDIYWPRLSWWRTVVVDGFSAYRNPAGGIPFTAGPRVCGTGRVLSRQSVTIRCGHMHLARTP